MGYKGIEGVTGDYRDYSLLQQHEQDIYLTALVRGFQGVIEGYGSYNDFNGVTRGCGELQEVIGGDDVIGGYRGLEGVTGHFRGHRCYRGLQGFWGVTKGYRRL